MKEIIESIWTNSSSQDSKNLLRESKSLGIPTYSSMVGSKDSKMETLEDPQTMRSDSKVKPRLDYIKIGSN